eukprot:GHVT01092163.1.p1 GENE.GHVT01092163.1~~GHVT01092163.1.p1  ORF type:complete len:386 (-),score=70.89 GHVT01092163.1:876-2033(-)
MMPVTSSPRKGSIESKLSLSLDQLIDKQPRRGNTGRRRGGGAVGAGPATSGPTRNRPEAKARTTPYGPRSTGPVGGRGAKPSAAVPKAGGSYYYTVRVHGLPTHFTHEEVHKVVTTLFSQVGAVAMVKHRPHSKLCFVCFEHSDSCGKALQILNGAMIKGGHVLMVEPGVPIDRQTGVPVENPRHLSTSPGVSAWSSTAVGGGVGGAPSFGGRGGGRFPGGYVPAGGSPYARQPYGVGPSVHPGGIFAPEHHGRGGMSGVILGASPNAFKASQPLRPSPTSPYATTGSSVAASALTAVVPPPEPVARPGTTVIVTNVPHDLTAQELQDAFSMVGTVLRTEILLNSNGAHTGRAAVTFESSHAAEEAVRRFDGGDLNSNTIRVFLE